MYHTKYCSIQAHLVEVLDALPVRPLRVGINVHLHDASLRRQRKQWKQKQAVQGLTSGIVMTRSLFVFLT